MNELLYKKEITPELNVNSGVIFPVLIY